MKHILFLGIVFFCISYQNFSFAASRTKTFQNVTNVATPQQTFPSRYASLSKQTPDPQYAFPTQMQTRGGDQYGGGPVAYASSHTPNEVLKSPSRPEVAVDLKSHQTPGGTQDFYNALHTELKYNLGDRLVSMAVPHLVENPKKDFRAAMYGVSTRYKELDIPSGEFLRMMEMMDGKRLERMHLTKNNQGHHISSIIETLWPRKFPQKIGGLKPYGAPRISLIKKVKSIIDFDQLKDPHSLFKLPEDSRPYMFMRPVALLGDQHAGFFLGRPPIIKGKQLVKPGRVDAMFLVAPDKSGIMTAKMLTAKDYGRWAYTPKQLTALKEAPNANLKQQWISRIGYFTHEAGDDAKRFITGEADILKMPLNPQETIDYVWNVKLSNLPPYNLTSTNCFSFPISLCHVLGKDIEFKHVGDVAVPGQVDPKMVEVLKNRVGKPVTTLERPIALPEDEVFFVIKEASPIHHGYLVVGQRPRPGVPGRITALMIVNVDFNGSIKFKIHNEKSLRKLIPKEYFPPREPGVLHVLTDPKLEKKPLPTTPTGSPELLPRETSAEKLLRKATSPKALPGAYPARLPGTAPEMLPAGIRMPALPTPTAPAA